MLSSPQSPQRQSRRITSSSHVVSMTTGCALAHTNDGQQERLPHGDPFAFPMAGGYQNGASTVHLALMGNTPSRAFCNFVPATDA